MEHQVEIAMKRAMDRLAVEEGKKVLFKAVFGDKWDWTARSYHDDRMERREFVRRTIRFSNMPDTVSVEFLDAYFSDEISSAYMVYLKKWSEEHKGADDEADE